MVAISCCVIAVSLLFNTGLFFFGALIQGQMCRPFFGDSDASRQIRSALNDYSLFNDDSLIGLIDRCLTSNHSRRDRSALVRVTLTNLTLPSITIIKEN